MNEAFFSHVHSIRPPLSDLICFSQESIMGFKIMINPTVTTSHSQIIILYNSVTQTCFNIVQARVTHL